MKTQYVVKEFAGTKYEYPLRRMNSKTAAEKYMAEQLAKGKTDLSISSVSFNESFHRACGGYSL